MSLRRLVQRRGNTKKFLPVASARDAPGGGAPRVRKPWGRRRLGFLWRGGEEPVRAWRAAADAPSTEQLGTFGPGRARTSDSCGRRPCGGASGCGRGLLTAASRRPTAPNSPPAEPVRRRRAGCGNGLRQKHRVTRCCVLAKYLPNHWMGFTESNLKR